MFNYLSGVFMSDMNLFKKEYNYKKLGGWILVFLVTMIFSLFSSLLNLLKLAFDWEKFLYRQKVVFLWKHLRYGIDSYFVLNALLCILALLHFFFVLTCIAVVISRKKNGAKLICKILFRIPLLSCISALITTVYTIIYYGYGVSELVLFLILASIATFLYKKKNGGNSSWMLYSFMPTISFSTILMFMAYLIIIYGARIGELTSIEVLFEFYSGLLYSACWYTYFKNSLRASVYFKEYTPSEAEEIAAAPSAHEWLGSERQSIIHAFQDMNATSKECAVYIEELPIDLKSKEYKHVFRYMKAWESSIRKTQGAYYLDMTVLENPIKGSIKSGLRTYGLIGLALLFILMIFLASNPI